MKVIVTARYLSNTCHSRVYLVSPGLTTIRSGLLLIFPYSSAQHVKDIACGSAGKESACNVGDLALIPGLGRSPGGGNRYPLQYSGLENSMDCIAHGVAKSQTQLSDFHFQVYLSKELVKSLHGIEQYTRELCSVCMRAQMCQLCNPMNCSPPRTFVHEVFQARILERVAIPSPGDLPNPGIEPESCISCIGRQVL